MKDWPQNVKDAAAALDVEKLCQLLGDETYIKETFDAILVEAKASRKRIEAKGKSLAATVNYKLMLERYHSDAVNLLRQTQIRALEKRVAELEARPSMKYHGVWEPKNYALGAFVTANGSVWHCRTPAGPNDAPNASHCWQLAVKRGRDAQRERA